jgi:iron transport multicopper oxidase
VNSTQSILGAKADEVENMPDSTVLTLADWYHDPSQTRADRYPFPNSVLINGLGRTPSTLSAPLATINVSQGRRYRIRLLNIACDPHFIFSVDSHNFTVIEVDGVNVTPVVVDSITIYASQRYSVILTASAPAGNYWIRAYPFKGPSGFAGGINSAVLHYDAAPIAEPSPIDPPPPHSTPLDESNLTPLVPDVLGIPDMRVNLEFAHDPDKDIFAVNGVSFLPPSVPALLQILSGTRDPKEILPEGSVFPLGTGVVEMSMPGTFRHAVHADFH